MSHHKCLRCRPLVTEVQCASQLRTHRHGAVLSGGGAACQGEHADFSLAIHQTSLFSVFVVRGAPSFFPRRSSPRACRFGVLACGRLSRRNGCSDQLSKKYQLAHCLDVSLSASSYEKSQLEPMQQPTASRLDGIRRSSVLGRSDRVVRAMSSVLYKWLTVDTAQPH